MSLRTQDRANSPKAELHSKYCAFIGALGITCISERFEGHIFEGLEGLFGCVSQWNDLLVVIGTWKAHMRKAALAAF